MLEWWSKGLVCGCALVALQTAQAAEFSVGRVDVVFAEEGWREMPLPDQSTVPSADGLPKDVPATHVAWGRQLKDAVKSSVHSFSGRLDIPPIQMTTPVTSGVDGGR